jgi:hypothetical protein
MWVANAIAMRLFGIETVINKLEFQRSSSSRTCLYILCDGWRTRWGRVASTLAVKKLQQYFKNTGSLTNSLSN